MSLVLYPRRKARCCCELPWVSSVYRHNQAQVVLAGVSSRSYQYQYQSSKPYHFTLKPSKTAANRSFFDLPGVNNDEKAKLELPPRLTQTPSSHSHSHSHSQKFNGVSVCCASSL
eukprot:scaffold35817_cov61-Cyclotella_meneghiniana.AAC.4